MRRGGSTGKLGFRELDRNVTGTPDGFPNWHTVVVNLTLAAEAHGCSDQKFIICSAELRFGLRWWEIACLLLVLKAGGAVRAVAKRLTCGMPATAERD